MFPHSVWKSGKGTGSIAWWDSELRLRYPFGIESLLRAALRFLEPLLYIILGNKAFRQGSFHIPGVDTIIHRYMR